MKCFNCLRDNPPGQIHCVKCGVRLDLRPEEVHAILAQKAKIEQQKKTEFYTSTFLIFAIALFVASLTFLVISGEPPKDTYFVPSISKDAEYIKLEERQYMFSVHPRAVLVPAPKRE